jgi:CRISPR-associated protein Cas1
MADNWRILDFSNFKGTLRYAKKRLEVIDESSGELRQEALRDVNIVFIGIGVKLSPAVMYHFATEDVVVLFCDWKGLPVSGMYPWVDAHGRVAARQRAQAALTLPRTKNAWMRIIKAKIQGQANNLDVLQRQGAKRLKELVGMVRSGDISNIEGQSARIYWKELFINEEFGRLPGQGAGGRNALLDYGYTILRGHSMRAVLSAGLTPALGLYHRGRSNSFALADDLIEPFRPVIDLAVAQMSQEVSLADSEVKRSLLQASLSSFRADGSSTPTVMTEFAQQLGRYVEGETELLKPPVWNPRVVI